MEFMKLATERYSVRKFKEGHLEQNLIDEILKAGHLAPTGCNNQPQRILVINTDEAIAKLQQRQCHSFLSLRLVHNFLEYQQTIHDL